MSRYLTPSKTALLLLITIYLEGSVSSTSTVPVLSFIITNVLPSKRHARDPLSMDSLERALTLYKSIIPGRTLWDLLLNRLWSIDSGDNYYKFLDTLHRLQADPDPSHDLDYSEESKADYPAVKLSRSSPLGAFVRRAQVEFIRLTFGDSILLWKDFVAFRQPSFNAFRKRNVSSSQALFDTSFADIQSKEILPLLYDDLDSRRSGVGFFSTEDVDRLLDFQVAEMSRTGHRLPSDVQRKLEIMAHSQVTIPSAIHYVKFLDSWKAGDYPAALDSLHRYFDYTIQDRGKSHYQYALLNMALLHAHFGCHVEAISAMKETVSTARENKDMACLNYSLSWLFHFGQAHPEEAREIQKSGVLGSGREALAFLRTKARENDSWQLLSSTMIAEARLAILSGDGHMGIVENLVRASHVNLTKRHTAGFIGQMSVESVLWTRLGVSELAATKNELLRECYADVSTKQEMLGTLSRLAQAAATRGRHREAIQILSSVPSDSLRGIKTQSYWSGQFGLVKLRHALYQNDLIAATHYLSQLQTMPNMDADFGFSTGIMQIHLQIRQGNLVDAMSSLNALSAKVDAQHADIANRIKLMVLKAKIWNKAGTPQKAFTIALRACSAAYDVRLLLGLWESVAALCEILNALEEYKAARDLLVSSMPQLLIAQDRQTAAEAYSVLADAHMGMAGKAGKASLKRREEMTRSLDYLDRAFDHYSAISNVNGQCETLVKKATIMRLNGDHVLANDIAAKSLAVSEQNREKTTQ